MLQINNLQETKSMKTIKTMKTQKGRTNTIKVYNSDTSQEFPLNLFNVTKANFHKKNSKMLSQKFEKIQPNPSMSHASKS